MQSNTPIIIICCSTSVSAISKVSFWCLIWTFLGTGTDGSVVESHCLSGIGVSSVLGEGTAGRVLTLAFWTIPSSKMLSKYPTTNKELESPHWSFSVLSSRTKPLQVHHVCIQCCWGLIQRQHSKKWARVQNPSSPFWPTLVWVFKSPR